MTDPIPFYLAEQEFDPEIPVASLHEHPENYNRGDTEAIAASLDKYGLYGAVLVQKSTRAIIAGNHRHRVASAKGAATIPGFWLDVDDDTARSILADDNGTTHLATFDEPKLIALLTRAKDSPTGLPVSFGADRLAAMVRHQASITAAPGDPNAEWEGMPDFDQPDGKPAYSITMHFPDDASADEFFKRLGVAERPKTRYLWWPHHDGFKGIDYENVEVASGPEQP